MNSNIILPTPTGNATITTTAGQVNRHHRHINIPFRDNIQTTFKKTKNHLEIQHGDFKYKVHVSYLETVCFKESLYDLQVTYQNGFKITLNGFKISDYNKHISLAFID